MRVASAALAAPAAVAFPDVETEAPGRGRPHPAGRWLPGHCVCCLRPPWGEGNLLAEGTLRPPGPPRPLRGNVLTASWLWCCHHDPPGDSLGRCLVRQVTWQCLNVLVGASTEWSRDPQWTRPPAVPVPWSGLVPNSGRGPRGLLSAHSVAGLNRGGWRAQNRTRDPEPKDGEVAAPIIRVDYTLR